jgi:hypothetical protein
VRAVVPVRLSDAERGQIAGAASRLELTLSGFIRQASLEASARVERKVALVPAETGTREAAEPEPRQLVVVEPEAVHYVDGEPVRR